MSKQVIWTSAVLNAFIEEGNLSDEERLIIMDHAAELSRVQICCKHNISLPTLDRRISRLKSKYDAAQLNSAILPKRKHGADDLF